MATVHSELLKDEKVKQEILKHKWIESEKAGHDIGYEKAAEDWLQRYGSKWATKPQQSFGFRK